MKLSLKFSKLEILLLLAVPDAILTGYGAVLFNIVLMKAITAHSINYAMVLTGIGGILAIAAHVYKPTSSWLKTLPIRKTAAWITAFTWLVLIECYFLYSIDTYWIINGVISCLLAMFSNRWRPRLEVSNVFTGKDMEILNIYSRYISRAGGLIGSLVFLIMGSVEEPMMAMIVLSGLFEVDYVVSEILIWFGILEFHEQDPIAPLGDRWEQLELQLVVIDESQLELF